MSTDQGQGGVSTKPYLLRAIYEWAVDNVLTPQILVDATRDEVVVPRDAVQDGQIVLNIHPQSVQGLELGNEYLMFSARFSGKSFEVCVPLAAVKAIYARENGQGIVFHADGSGQTPPPAPKKEPDQSGPGDSGGSHLKLVK